MKNKLLLILVFLIAQSCAVTKTTDKVIFRHLNLNSQFGTIDLNTKKDAIEHLIHFNDGKYFLKDETFGIAKSIELVFDNKNSLKKMIFSYRKDWQKENEINDYKSYLGEPIIKNDKLIWNDGKTKFEIYTIDSQTYSELTDL